MPQNNPITQAQPPHVVFEWREISAREDHQLEGLGRTHPRDCFQQQIDAFGCTQIGGVQDHRLFAEPKFAPHDGARTRGFLRVEEIMDDVDWTLHPQQSLGFAAQKFRNRRHRVGLRERMADRRTVTGVAAEQRGVGAVEGRDHPRFLPRRQHRAREDRRRGVRHRVMDVQYVEPVVAADLGHLHGERQRVVGVFEEAVVVDHDRMEK